MALYLGIDAGGTKTECVLAGPTGVLGRSIAGSCKVLRVGRDVAAHELSSAVHQALADAGCEKQDVTSCCVGLAGASHPDVFSWMRTTMAALLDAPCMIVGDHLIALEAAFRGGPGVIVISGTGSIAFARNAQGVTARAGGWGPIISDEGSGFWIGRLAAGRAMRAWDAGRNSALLDQIMVAWRVRTREEMVAVVNASPGPDFSALAPLVAEAAGRGDATAVRILQEAGRELAGLAESVLWKLWREAPDATVRAAGGILQGLPMVCEGFRESLLSAYPGLRWDPEPVHPVEGALFLARKMDR
jgi:glucosamine kinase